MKKFFLICIVLLMGLGLGSMLGQKYIVEYRVKAISDISTAQHTYKIVAKWGTWPQNNSIELFSAGIYPTNYEWTGKKGVNIFGDFQSVEVLYRDVNWVEGLHPEGWHTGFSEYLHDTNSMSFSRSFEFTSDRSGNPKVKCSVTLNLKPDISVATSEKYLSQNRKSTIWATHGFAPSVYYWEYRLPGKGWKRLYSLRGSSDLKVDTNDFPDEQMHLYYGQRIEFRVESAEVPVSLEIRPSLPLLASHKSTPTSCPDKNDGIIELFFARPLTAGESLQIFWDGEEVLRTSTLETGNKLTLPGLKSKENAVLTIAGSYDGIIAIGDEFRGNYSMTVGKPEAVQFSHTFADIECYDEKGTIKVTASGGNERKESDFLYKLHYKKDQGAYQEEKATGNIFELKELEKGSYEYYVSDSKGCFVKDAVGNPLTLRKELNAPDPISINITPTNLSGFNKNNGKIVADVSGGTPGNPGEAYTIILSKEGVSTPIHNVKGSTLIKDKLAKGTYIITVTDQKCTQTTENIILTEPDDIVIKINEPQKILCYGTSTAELRVTVSGGSPHSTSGYTYAWYQKNGANYVPYPEYTHKITGLAAGFYKVKVSDHASPANSKELPYEVKQPLKLATVLATKNLNCFGDNSGQISLKVQGGAGNYQLFYKRVGIDPNYKTGTINPADQTFYLKNLPAGTYSIYAIDGNNCQAPVNGQDVANIILTQPEALRITSEQIIKAATPTATNAQITIEATGGTLPHTTQWKNSSGTLLSAVNTTSNGKTTSVLSNLTKGNYALILKDANACSVPKSYTVSVIDPLSLTIETEQIPCNGSTGTITAQVLGGLPSPTGSPYTYQWYRISGTSQTLIPEANTSILPNLSVGKYKVKVTDSATPNNQIESAVIEITQPTALLTSIKTKGIACFGGNDGQISIKVQGGADNYKLFYQHIGIDATYKTHPITASDQTFYLNHLLAGKYRVYIQDKNNCYAPINGADIAEITLEQPQALTLIPSQSNPTSHGRNDGSMTIEISGGTSGYIVLWKDASGGIFPGSNTQGEPFANTLTNMEAGHYTVDVKDTHSCTASAQFDLVQPDELLVSLSNTSAIACHGSNEGRLEAAVTGGIPNTSGIPYQYRWLKQNGNAFEVLPNTGSTLNHIYAGVYKVEVSDFSTIANTASATFTLAEPQKIEITAPNQHVSCGGTAILSATASGGLSPYKYEWNTGHTGSTVSKVHSGKYSVVVTDTRKCQSVALVTVTSPAQIEIAGNPVTHPSCFGSKDGNIRLDVSGGKAPYKYQWEHGSNKAELSDLAPGKYSVLITDQSNCSHYESFTLTEPELFIIYLGEDRTLCKGQELVLSPYVEDKNSRFQWTGPNGFRSAASQIIPEQSGTYRLTVTNSNGCSASDEIEIKYEARGISSEIIVASQVFAGEEMIIVNISNPAPDKVEWKFPESGFVNVTERNDHFAKVIFSQTGSYPVGIRSYVASCYQENEKTILVLDPDEMDTKEDIGVSLIQAFTLYPNPNSGTFQANIKLSKESTVRLRLINIATGNVLDDRRLDRLSEYQVDYHLKIPVGVYILSLETTAGRMILRVVIN